MSGENISGFVERYNATTVSGWARLPKTGMDSALILFVDGIPVAETTPDIPRADFDGESIGFSVTLDEGVAPRRACRLEVRTKDSGTHIANSPVVVLLADEDAQKEVLQGREGFLFLANGTNRVIDQIEGRLLLSDQSAEEWRVFSSQLNKLGERGVDCRYLVVPNKECVLPHLLPEGISIRANRPVSQVTSILSSTWCDFYSNFFYPLSSLKSSFFGQSFPRGDTHWTTYGAWSCIEAMLAGSYRSEISDITSQVTGTAKKWRYENADLLSKLGGDCVEPKPLFPLELSGIEKTFDNGEINTGSRTTWNYSHPEVKRKVLLCHDSFGVSMVPYLARIFGEVHTLWSATLPEKVIDEINPDIIIFERVERFLIQASRIE